jgi:hypothetical protein
MLYSRHGRKPIVVGSSMGSSMPRLGVDAANAAIAAASFATSRDRANGGENWYLDAAVHTFALHLEVMPQSAPSQQAHVYIRIFRETVVVRVIA